MFMSVIQGMIDRRIISYETGIEKLGLDFSTELSNMTQELPLVMGGYLGIIGSPYNPKAMPPEGEVIPTDTTDDSKPTVVTREDLDAFQKNVEEMINQNLQPTQKTPKGTPSEGRPRKGGKGKPKAAQTKPNIKPSKPQK